MSTMGNQDTIRAIVTEDEVVEVTQAVQNQATVVPATGVISTLTGKRKKVYKTTSEVWKHFTKIDNYCDLVLGCGSANPLLLQVNQTLFFLSPMRIGIISCSKKRV